MSQSLQLSLRRSKRKLASINDDSTKFDTPPPTTKKAKKAKVSSKKAKKAKVSIKRAKKVSAKDSTKLELSNPVRATLMSLNYDVQDKLLQYLDVQVRLSNNITFSSEILFFNLQSLEALSKTCSHFDLMINGRYLTSVSFPFGGRFLNDIEKSQIFEKKSVLRLECKNNLSSPHFDMSMFVETSLAAKQYLIQTQLSLLNLSKVREVDLVPVNI